MGCSYGGIFVQPSVVLLHTNLPWRIEKQMSLSSGIIKMGQIKEASKLFKTISFKLWTQCQLLKLFISVYGD